MCSSGAAASALLVVRLWSVKQVFMLADRLFAVLLLQVGDAMPPIDDATFAEVRGMHLGSSCVGDCSSACAWLGPWSSIVSATAAAMHQTHVCKM
jgi:hypothetical protein